MPCLWDYGAAGYKDTPAEAATARLMRSAWASFARDPHRALGKRQFHWPALPSSANRTGELVMLGLGNATPASFEPAAAVDALCPQLLSTYEALGGPLGLLALVPVTAEAVAGIQDGDVVAVGEALLKLAQTAEKEG